MKFFIALMFAPAISLAANFKVTDGKIQFVARATPGSVQILGEGAKPEGQIQEKSGKYQGQIVTKLEDFTTGIGLRDRHLKEKYLQVKDHPQAELTVSHIDAA